MQPFYVITVGEKRMNFKAAVLVILFLSVIARSLSPVEGSSDVIRVPRDYPTIQDAIDAASPGDTIVVSKGLYAEGQIKVTKPLTLIANGKVTVDGLQRRWGVFYVTSDNVTIKGFTVTNGGYAGIYLPWGAANCVVENNVITKSLHGIQVDGQRNIIKQNKVVDNSGDGFILHGVFNIIEQNTITDNRYSGISLWLSSYNIIRKNVIKESFDGGIRLQHSSYNNISGNIIMQNDRVGIWLYESAYNTVMGNVVINNNGTGISSAGGGCNLIEENKVVGNARDGISMYVIWYGNVVKRNRVNGNARYGISVRLGTSNSIIRENTVLHNNDFDLYWDRTGTGNVWIENVYKTKSW